MTQFLLRRIRKMNNDQLSNTVLFAIGILMAITFVPPIGKIVALLAIGFSAGNFSHDIAKLIDWLDDSDEYAVEIPWRYHFIYGFGLSIAAGIIVGIIGSALVPFSPALYALINPKIVFFSYGFVSSAAGYAIAWRTIPNKKGRK